MQKHTKIYMDFFGYGEQDFIPSEVSGTKANDVHHIYGRGKEHDIIENLIGLNREEHKAAHKELQNFFLSTDDLIAAHRIFIMNNRPDYKFDIEKLNKLK
jgi:hypothetical protein